MAYGTKENLRHVSVKVVENAIHEGIVNITYKLPEDIKKALKDAHDKENNPLAKYVLNQLIINHEIAYKERTPLCQDTGSIILFMEVGQDVYFTDGYILSAVNKAVSRTTSDKYLRSSMVLDAIARKNKTDNNPPVIHIEYTRGNRVKLYIMTKGGGAENTSLSRMLPLSYASKENIKKFIVKWVIENVRCACPPVTVGVGLGSTSDYVPVLAKKALLRKIGSKNKNPFYEKMERDLLSEINKSNIGPQGIGGRTTAFAVFLEAQPCHIASLPIAININCNSSRVTKIVI